MTYLGTPRGVLFVHLGGKRLQAKCRSEAGCSKSDDTNPGFMIDSKMTFFIDSLYSWLITFSLSLKLPFRHNSKKRDKNCLVKFQYWIAVTNF